MTFPAEHLSGAFLDSALALEAAEQPKEALAQARRALDAAPGDLRAKRFIARLLRHHPNVGPLLNRATLQRLVSDPDVDPDDIVAGGWNHLLDERTIALDGDPAAMTAALENDALALIMLREACVFVLDAERTLSAVRRWLLLSDKWSEYPKLAQALAAQIVHNGGAWPFDADERAILKQSPTHPLAAAYVCPSPPRANGVPFGDVHTRAVAENYDRWPYPQWSRITLPETSTVVREVEKLDGGRPSRIPLRAQILVAGCGTGREAAMLARRFPDSQVTAIDISERALAYAADHCAGLAIDFRQLDLHRVADLDRRFDLIACSGVLHHLPDPETGWARLADTLTSRGVMKVMVYSRVARLRIAAAKAHIADLLELPIDDDLLREVRRRLIESALPFVTDFADFYSLNGVHDLLLNRYEDCFDVPRIVRGLDSIGLELLGFKLPTKVDDARYRREHPSDPLLRDTEAWGALEKAHPFLFSEMYEFWCRARPR